MDVRSILKANWFTPGLKGRWGLPILFEGPPGSAKTANIESAASSCGLHCEVVIASLREPADFLGIPVPKDGKMMYLPPSWAQRAAEMKRCVVFKDELNTAAPAVQAALLRTVLDGVAGDLVLPNTVRFVAAQNKTEDAAGGWDLAAPLANRFGHMPWSMPDVPNWTAWLLNAGTSNEADDVDFNAEAEEKRVMAAWDKPFAMAKGLVAGFLRARPDLLHMQPKAGDAAASKAWPSPRTWEMATRAVAGAKVHSLSAVDEDEMIAAFIGANAAGELFTFRQNADLPDPEDLLDEKVPFKHDDRRLDRTVAILASCAALLANAALKKRNDRAKVMWKIMGDLIDNNADLVVPAGLSMVNSRLIGLTEARPVLATLAPVLRAAGIRPTG